MSGQNAIKVSTNAPIKDAGLKYLPAPTVEPGFYEQMRSIVGIDGKTGEMPVRFVWGMDRLEFADGIFVRRYPDVDNKYVGAPYWILEGWQPSDIYDRAEWELNEALLGPWPHNGVWDFVAFVRNPDMTYRPLDGRALDMLRQWKQWHEPRKSEVVADLIALRNRLKQREQKTAKAKTDEEFARMNDDILKVEHGKPVNAAFSLPRFLQKTRGASTPSFTRTDAGLILPPGVMVQDNK